MFCFFCFFKVWYLQYWVDWGRNWQLVFSLSVVLLTIVNSSLNSWSGFPEWKQVFYYLRSDNSYLLRHNKRWLLSEKGQWKWHWRDSNRQYVTCRQKKCKAFFSSTMWPETSLCPERVTLNWKRLTDSRLPFSLIRIKCLLKEERIQTNISDI